MAFKGKARAGLLLFLTAGPFLVFLFLYLFGKNHFELDRYPAKSDDFLTEDFATGQNLLILDTNLYSCKKSALKSQLGRLAAFWEDAGSQPEMLLLEGANTGFLNQLGRSWFQNQMSVSLTSAKGQLEKKLPDPPRAFLFDKEKTLRGVYGLCSNKSVDTLMLEYRILTSE